MDALRVGLAVLLGAAMLWSARPRDEAAIESQRRLVALEAAINEGAASDMQALFPEGFVFTHALTALAWADLAAQDPGLRDEAAVHVFNAVQAVDSEAGRAPFVAAGPLRTGIFHRGWLAYLRARLHALDGSDAEQLAADCADLAAAVSDSPTPFLAAYPGMAWPVDSVVAVAAISRCGGHDRVVDDWLAEALDRADSTTGLLPHHVDAVTGRGGAARGSSAALILRFLHEIDPSLAAEHYARFRQHFVVTRLGLPAVIEHVGGGGPGDIDSGPLIAGVSLSASAVGAGVARLHGDEAVADALLRAGHALALTTDSGGGRHAFGGMVPVGDAFVAWAWAAPLGADPGHPALSIRRWPRVVLGLLLIAGLIIGPARRRLRSSTPE